MKLVIFGLTVSSSWGNGHATLWRGIIRALAARGHDVVFFERDVPYYAEHRDLAELNGAKLILYPSWAEVLPTASRHVREADAVMTTSYCPDAIAAGELMREINGLRVFYDLDTPVTFSRLNAGETVEYIGENGLADFDLVLSYTGGQALEELRTRLGARAVAPLYGSVDPSQHRPVEPVELFRGSLSYLGTYAEDRQAVLEELFLRPARLRPHERFVIGGAKYPDDFPWTPNLFFFRHLAPEAHPAFFCSSRLTLNVTRESMAAMGYCPSGRLFEAAACGAPIVSDSWAGLDEFFEPGREILLASNAEDTLAALDLSEAELRRISVAARERVLAEHTAEHRAIELEQILSAKPLEAVC